jgi:hypothetical protein
MIFPFSFIQSESAGDYDPAVLSLTGWWRAPFTGSPWAGESSAGSSSGRNLTEATNPPSTGSEDEADFDGTNDILANATAMSTMITASAYFMWALVWIDAIDTANDESTAYSNDPIICDSGGYWGMHLTTNGGNKVQMFHWDGAGKAAEATVSTGQWTLIMARYDGTNIRIQVNSGSVVTRAAGSVSTLTGTVQMAGRGAGFANIKVRDGGVMASAGSDGLFSSIKSYVNTFYGLSL